MGSVRIGLDLRHYTRAAVVTFDALLWAIIGVGVAVTGVGVSGLGLGFLAYRTLHGDIVGLQGAVSDLPERMAKLEGAVDGFMRGSRQT